MSVKSIHIDEDAHKIILEKQKEIKNEYNIHMNVADIAGRVIKKYTKDLKISLNQE